MEKRELTPQIAGMYFGCDAQWIDECNPSFEKVIGRLCEVSDTKVTIHDGKECYECMPFECKLILTPLSEISDVDAIEIGKIAGKNHMGQLELGKEMARLLLSRGWNYFDATAVIQITTYLRSKSYDCDNLITQGIAITKLA
jgi:hypothetical protein